MRNFLRMIAASFMLLSSSVFAGAFSFTGNLANDDDVLLFEFTVRNTSSITLQTFSYAGGTNSEGTVISVGGFDPILAVFDGGGNLFGQNDDGDFPDVDVDLITGNIFDTFLEIILDPDTYTVSVMQFSNFATGPSLADGFGGSGTTNFADIDGNIRTSFFAFDVSGDGIDNAQQVAGGQIPEPSNDIDQQVAGAQIPEPSAALLIFFGMFSLAVNRRRKA